MELEKRIENNEVNPADDFYSREKLVELLKSLEEELGRSPTMLDMDNAEGYPCAKTYQEKLGSWNTAKAEAGLEVFDRGIRPPKSYSEKELLDKLKSLAKELGRSPTKEDMRNAKGFPSPTTYDQIGGWTAAKERVGLETFDSRRRPGTYSNKELHDNLKSLEKELGRPPTSRDMIAAKGYPSAKPYRRFGGWNAAKQKAGLL